MEKNQIRKLSKNFNLEKRSNILDFIKDNPLDLNISELSEIAEVNNNLRDATAAYYTDKQILDEIYPILPTFNGKDELNILEPSAGIGNFIQLIVDKYASNHRLVNIYVNDIDPYSLKIAEALNSYRHIPDNVNFIYLNKNFMSPFFDSHRYDLVIGNPPFIRLSKEKGLLNYQEKFNDFVTKNLSGFFLQQAMRLAKYTILIMPKYFLNSPDFENTRQQVADHVIENIIDFGELGFRGVRIETVAIRVSTDNAIEKKSSNMVKVYSVPRKESNILLQSHLVESQYPYWIIYRNKFFDDISKKLKFNVFKVFRDRQLTNRVLKKSGEVRVLRSRNIEMSGKRIINIDGYDRYINKRDMEKLSIKKYFPLNDVYLVPNMTYYPRIIKKPSNCVTNGSIAILIPKKNVKISKKSIDFINSDKFKEFYSIARNYSTRSLNIDKYSVFFFGILKS